jgi:hypothetical protein
MKRMITMIFIFNSFFWLLSAPAPVGLVIIAPDKIEPYEAIWNAVCKVESSGNPLAIGDKNLKHHSYGVAQIRLSRLDDYYRQTGIRYYERDMFDVEKSKAVFMWYCSKVHPDNIREIVCSWNAGPNWKKKKSVEKYYLKIQKNL